MASLRRLVERDVPKAWEAQLREFSPPTTRFTYLKLRWEPGYPWESPVERWIIDQMIPEHAVEEGILEQLRDYPPPSAMGNHYDAVLGEFVRNPDCLITERAWHTFRETRCWARPFWVIQGPNGGHKRWFSNVERNFLKLAGLPEEPPVPGDLEYADFDERVMAHLRAYDLLRNQHAGLKRKRDLLGGLQDARTEAEERRFREQMVKWLSDQVTEAAEGVTESLMLMDAPRRDIDVREIERRDEQAMQNYIELGNSHGGAVVGSR